MPAPQPLDETVLTTIVGLRSHTAWIATHMERDGGDPIDRDLIPLLAATTGFDLPRGDRLGWAPHRLLAVHGIGWTGQPLPPRITRGLPKNCYNNAWDRARRSQRYAYCEGYAAMTDLGVPIEHAWLLDTNTGQIVDPTWDHDPDRPHAYLGVAIPTDVVREARARSFRSATAVLWGDWARDFWFSREAAEQAIEYTRSLQ